MKSVNILHIVFIFLLICMQLNHVHTYDILMPLDHLYLEMSTPLSFSPQGKLHVWHLLSNWNELLHRIFKILQTGLLFFLTTCMVCNVHPTVNITHFICQTLITGANIIATES